MESTGSGKVAVSSFCGHIDGLRGFHASEEFMNRLSNYQILKRNTLHYDSKATLHTGVLWPIRMKIVTNLTEHFEQQTAATLSTFLFESSSHFLQQVIDA